MTAELKKYLRNAMRDELRDVAREFTVRGIQLRVVKRVLDSFKITKEEFRFIVDPDVCFVHPQVSAYLSEKFPVDSFVNDHKEWIFKRFFSSDYHLKSDLLEYADLFDSEVSDPEQRCWLNFAFAVDGFRGKKLRNYIDNLGREMREVPVAERDWEKEDKGPVTPHVSAVRSLHEELGPMKPDIVRMGIQCAFDETDSSSYQANKVAELYTENVGQIMVKVKDYIESNYVCFDGKKLEETNTN